MHVTVKVATMLLSKVDPPLCTREFDRTLEEGIDVEGLIAELGIPRRLVGSVTVNRKRSRLERGLADGDVVAIIPAISGG